MNRLLAASAIWVLSVTAASASVMETMGVPFNAPSFGSTNSYYDQVRITVSGTGNSLGTRLNDAFYLFNGTTNASEGHDSTFYQLNFGTSPLIGFNGLNAATVGAQNADNFIVGGLPAYSASHVYSFFLNVGTMTPSTLYFGVSDGIFSDNSGEYRIKIEQVPEAEALALVAVGLLALFGIGGVRRRSTRA